MQLDIIRDVPVPQLNTSDPNLNTNSANGSVPSTDSPNGVSPSSFPDANIPLPSIASDVIGTSIDTQNRRILGNFSFGKVGALQIGQFKQGVSGQINISPNGIIAENKSGVTTVSIDGTTGNAFFSGTLSLGGISNAGVLSIYDNLGNLSVQADNSGLEIFGQGTVKFAIDSNHNPLVTLGINPSNNHLLLEKYPATSPTFEIDMPVIIDNDLTITGTLNTGTFSPSSVHTGSLSVGGHFLNLADNLLVTYGGGSISFVLGSTVKTAIVETAQGYRELYCTESPDVWFMDFTDKEGNLDPLFVEVTEGEIHKIRCEDGSYQVWRKRKGFSDRRFKQSSLKNYLQNNAFWGMAHN